MKKLATKFFAIMLSSTLLVFCTFGSAFAWNEVYHTGDTIHSVNPSYLSYLYSGYTNRGGVQADIFSSMNVCCNVANVGPGTIISQGAMRIGNHNGFSTVTERMEYGPAVVNWGGSAQNQYIVSTYNGTISQAAGVGDIGASAWGVGTVKSNDGTSHNIQTGRSRLLVTAAGVDGAYVSGSLYDPYSLDSFNSPLSGKDNFIGNDGLLYGVAYLNEAGEPVMPDMARVLLDNGEYGYISVDEMNRSATDYSSICSNPDGVENAVLDMEAEVFKQAFAEYFGVNALSHEAAFECAAETRYENGKQKVIQIVESDTNDDLAAAINEGVIPSNRMIDILDESTSALNAEDVVSDSVDAGDISISEDAYRAILDIALTKLTATIPGYAADGATVVGEYTFSRL